MTGERRFKYQLVGGIQVRLKRQLLVSSLDRRSPVANARAQETTHMSLPYLFTSESVSDGHPDKLADRISDTVLDRCLTLDPDARVACETLLADDLWSSRASSVWVLSVP